MIHRFQDCGAIGAMRSPELAQLDDQLLDGLEFCSRVYTLFETIRREPDGPSRLRLRPSRLEKKLLEELMPICRYVQVAYRPGRYISVRWVDGNQRWDAELLQVGAYVGRNQYPAKAYLEVTCTMHPNEYLARELLDTKGVAFGSEGIRRLKDGTIESIPTPFKNDEFITTYAVSLKDRIAAKSACDYPADTTLVVQCNLNTIYSPDEWNQLVNSVRESVSAAPFPEIYLYDPIGQHSASLYF